MPEFKFGDLLRYPRDQDNAEPASWVFMFVGRRKRKRAKWIDVVVVRVHWQDDQWLPGDMLAAGIAEMVPLDE